MLTVNHFSTYANGGAAMAAKRIADGFPVDQVDTRFFFKEGESDSSGRPLQFEQRKQTFFYRKFQHKKILKDFQEADHYFQKHLANRPEDAATFSPARSFWETPIEQAALDADILHLHWIAFLFDYPTFFQSIGRRKPIVWTMHDMNPLTGGCHYSGSCDRFKFGCGNCPSLEAAGSNDISAFSFEHKKKSLSKLGLDIVAPSQWLLNLARQSPIFPRQTRWHHINYGIDTSAFAPIEKSAAKRQLGLRLDHPLILFGAQDLADPRKGFAPLKKALQQLDSKLEFQIGVFGNGDVGPLAPGRNLHHLGYLKTDEEKQRAYSAADLFVLPSLQDNQPQTGLESMACETPVVAFRSGGIPEYVIHEQTGLVATSGDDSELSANIQQLLENADWRRQLGTSARQLIFQEFETRKQTRRYMDLYSRLTGNHSRGSNRAA